jgi:lipoprotein-anchoring transpeptidase ErfK/SrfK
MKLASPALLLALVLTAFHAFAAPESAIVISVPDQKLVLMQNGVRVAEYPISTSRFGVGDRLGSYATPLGWLEVATKIGDNAPLGAVFKDRRPTGEVIRPNAPGRDPIVTRILWLRGLESASRNAYERGIYIHGTPVERLIGRPVSYGCIRMRSRDVAELYGRVDVGTRVCITPIPLRRVLAGLVANASPGNGEG